MRDLGLQLARAAAARALAAHEQTETHEAAPEAAPQQPTPKPADPDLAFARHSRSVRQSVELWEKITNNIFARRPHPQAAQESSNFDPDPYLDDFDNHPPTEKPVYCEADRGNLYEAVANLALIHPDHAEIPENLPEIIKETLTAHPNDHVSANFARVCKTYNIAPDRSRLQPHLESQLRPPAHYPKRE